MMSGIIALNVRTIDIGGHCSRCRTVIKRLTFHALRRHGVILVSG